MSLAHTSSILSSETSKLTKRKPQLRRVAVGSLLAIFILPVLFAPAQNYQHSGQFDLLSASAASGSYSFSYTVLSGDTLHVIGQKFGVAWQAIATANGISIPYTIYVGEVLQIRSSQPITLYTVQRGDYLSLIGQKFNVTWQSIAQLNNIQSPYTIFVGEQLEIPVVSPTVYYTVQPGDYLILIGQKLGVSWQTIAEVNNIQAPYELNVGQVLIIPENAGSGNGGSPPPPADPIAVGNPTEDQFDQTILYATKGTNVDPMMIKADMMTESNFNPNALSNQINYGCGGTHDMGLLQINPVCSGADSTQLLNPTYNIDFGVKLYANLYGRMTQQFLGCSTLEYWEMALGDYNTGNGVYGCGLMNSQAHWYSSTVMSYYSLFSSQAGYVGSL